MTIQLSTSDFQQLTAVLQTQPEFITSGGRYALLVSTFGDARAAAPILGRINIEGAPQTVAVGLVQHLSTYGQIEAGREALGVFIEYILQNTGGGDDADFLRELLERYHMLEPPKAPIPTLSAPQPLPDANQYLFISYAAPEQALADTIADYLSGAGFRVFLATRSIPKGANWDLAIEDGLRDTDTMVLLLSASSMPYRKEVYREWFYYDQENKPIIPLYVQDCTRHSRLLSLNYIDARTDVRTALNTLLDQLKS